MNCLSCGLGTPPGARFCPACGAQVGDEPPPPETLKVATITFVDVVGSTAQGSSMGPDEIRDLMAPFLEMVAKEIEACHGSIGGFQGDGVMAVFGVPQAHEDDPVRAVCAALQIQDRLKVWNESRSLDPGMQIRVGINTGEVSAGGALQKELVVTGDAVNVAARLEQSASPGEVILGQRTAAMVRRDFILRELPSFQAKGKVEPLERWQVLGPTEVASSEQYLLLRDMVGREMELDALAAQLDKVTALGEARAVIVVGDPGVGKSRLVKEFVDQRTDCSLLHGRCVPYGEGMTFSPLRDIVRTSVGLRDSDSREAAVTSITRFASQLVDGDPVRSKEAAAGLAVTLGLDLAEEIAGVMAPHEAYAQIVAASKLLIEAAASDGLAIVAIEDVHWADPTMLDVLEELVSTVARSVFFIFPTRSDLFSARPAWSSLERFSTLELDPLTEDAAATLLDAVLDTSNGSSSLSQRILTLSEGNPFFVQELIRQLIDLEALALRDGRWTVANTLDDIHLPDTVHAVIQARLDLLAPTERAIVQDAAVVGRSFSSDMLLGASPGSDPDAIVGALLERGFIVRDRMVSPWGGDSYRFQHALIRDVAYESVPRRRRAAAHARLGDWIVATSGERIEEFSELLAHHYGTAYARLQDDDLRRKARDASLGALRSALGRFALKEARTFGMDAIALSRADEERTEALERLGDAHYAASEGDAAWSVYTQLLEALCSPDDDAVVARVAARAALLATRFAGTMQTPVPVEEIRALIAEGLRAAGKADSRYRCMLILGSAFLHPAGYDVDEAECFAAAEQALSMAENLDDSDLTSAALDLISAFHIAAGEWGKVADTTRRRAALLPRLSDAREVGDTYGLGAWGSTYLGHYAEAVRQATACVEHSRGVDPGSYLHGLAWRVCARLLLGDWDLLLQDQAEIEKLAAEDGRDFPVDYCLRAYAAAMLSEDRRGLTQMADAHEDLLRRVMERGPSRGAFEPILARFLVERGRVEEGIEMLARDPGGHTGSPAETRLINLEALCEAVAAAGDWDQALVVVDAARREAERVGAVALPGYVDRLEGRLAEHSGDLNMALHSFKASTETFDRIGAKWEAAVSRSLWGTACLEVGDEEMGRGLLSAYREAFSRLGARFI